MDMVTKNSLVIQTKTHLYGSKYTWTVIITTHQLIIVINIIMLNNCTMNSNDLCIGNSS